MQPSEPDAAIGERKSARVIDNLLGEADIADAFPARIVEAADGNPLFVEQLLSMLSTSNSSGSGRHVAAR